MLVKSAYRLMEDRHKLFILQIKSLENLLKDHLLALKQNDKQILQKSRLIRVPDPRKYLPQPFESETSEKVSVFVKVNFLKIGAIDTSHDRYSAEVMIHLRWREPLLDDEEMREKNGADLSQFWNPKVSIANGIGELQYSTTYFLQIDEHGKAWIIEKRKTSAAQFFEFMELHKFPFDTQDLTITVTSERQADELEFIPDEKSSVNAGAFSAAQEWQIHKTVDVWTKLSVKTVHKKKLVHPCFCVATKAARRPQFFIYNVIVIMFAICSLSFSTFTVQLEMPESRLPLTFLLVLTTVTFKSVVNKSLPKISYLTYLDKYVLGSMTILCCICIWQSISGSVVNNWTQSKSITAYSTTNDSSWCPSINKQKSTELGQTIDVIVMGSLGFIYLAFHVGFFFVIRSQKENQRTETPEEVKGEGTVTFNYNRMKRNEPVHD